MKFIGKVSCDCPPRDAGTGAHGWGRVLFLALLEVLVCFVAPAMAETLTIGAAYSLKPVLRDVVLLFESEHPQLKVRLVYGPSQTLREQIEQGAPLDLFLPASYDQITQLQARALTINGPPRVYAATSLVLVASDDAAAFPVSFRSIDSKAVSRIAVGNPRTTALGIVTAQLLSKLYPGQELKSRFTYGQHSEILGLVHSGEADVGIVYRVDAINDGHVRILDAASVGDRSAVTFGGAVVWTCKPSALKYAQGFLEFLTSPSVQSALRKHGFDSVSSSISESQARNK